MIYPACHTFLDRIACQGRGNLPKNTAVRRNRRLSQEAAECPESAKAGGPKRGGGKTWRGDPPILKTVSNTPSPRCVLPPPPPPHSISLVDALASGDPRRNRVSNKNGVCTGPSSRGFALRCVLPCPPPLSSPSLDGRNRAIVIAESLARVIAAIRITSVGWRSYLLLKHRN